MNVNNFTNDKIRTSGTVGDEQRDDVQVSGKKIAVESCQHKDTEVDGDKGAVGDGQREAVNGPVAIDGNENCEGSDGKDAVAGSQCKEIETHGIKGADGVCQLDDIEVSAVCCGQRDDIKDTDKKGAAKVSQHKDIDVSGEKCAACGGQREEVGVTGAIDNNKNGVEKDAVAGSADGGGQLDDIEDSDMKGAVGGGSGTIDDIDNGEDSDDETAMEFVPWNDILPIKGKRRRWKLSEHNLTESEKMEELVNLNTMSN